MPGSLSKTDALVIVDLQRDFLPGGHLAVPRGDEVIPVLNLWIHAFVRANLPVFATRDWHPADHCSFKPQGGPWPVHCVIGSQGAEFAPTLELPTSTVIISKSSRRDIETYSGFEGTDLETCLRKLSMQRLYVGGLATDYCVLNTVRDGLLRGFEVRLLKKAIRAVNVKEGDGERAEQEMVRLGAILESGEPNQSE